MDYAEMNYNMEWHYEITATGVWATGSVEKNGF